ncbi:DUF5063 domain-containing protein [Leptospira interrogans]|uniref:DUF5063 domain-containing protein n=1 Tax=Leptospira interrogans TaxID=173 RepID=UPI0007745588|nr:DUF5063 domain-containing protein [Leptospira interrogans]
MSIIVDSSTSHFPEIKSFVEAVRQYCKMIESIDNQKELCTFLRQVAASIAHLYTCTFDLPEISLQYKFTEVISKSGEYEKSLSSLLGSYNFYNISLAPLDLTQPELAIGALSDDLGELYSDLKSALDCFDRRELSYVEHSLWSWKFGFETHWGEHLTNALQHIHFLLFDQYV